MFLVVFWHIMSLGFGINDSIVGQVFRTFRMPTFFFVSGFIGYKAISKFSSNFFVTIIQKKAFVQLVPTAIIFSFYKFAFGGSPVSFFEKGLVGYWFTLVLFEMFVLFYFTSFLLSIYGGSRLQNILFSILIVFSGPVGLYLLHLQDLAPRYVNVLSLGNFFVYLPFFFLGVLVRKYEDRALLLLTNKYFFTTCFSVFVVGLLLSNSFFSKESHFYLYYCLNEFILRYTGLFTTLNIFYCNSSFFDADGRISSIMQFVGSRTLDIYLLHYFFVPDLSVYKHYFLHDGHEFIVGELVLIGGLAAFIIAICLLISSCFRKSDILAKYLFGILPSKK